MTTIRLPFSSVAASSSTERRYQPCTASPTRRLTELLATSSRTNAISRGLLIAVPCSVKGGRSGLAGAEDAAFVAGTGGAGGGWGGRRDAEKERPFARDGKRVEGNSPKGIAWRRGLSQT